MTKQNKLSTGILAFAMMLLCVTQVLAQAQTGNTVSDPHAKKLASAAAANSVVGTNPHAKQAADQSALKQATVNQQRVADLQRMLGETKSSLESGVRSKSLSKDDVSAHNAKIAAIEQELNQLQPQSKNNSTK